MKVRYNVPGLMDSIRDLKMSSEMSTALRAFAIPSRSSRFEFKRNGRYELAKSRKGN